MEASSTTKILEYFEQEYLPSNLRITSNSTIKHYNITIRQFGEFLGRDAKLEDMTDGNATRFCRWLQLEKDIATQTIEQRMNYLRAIWRWCCRERLIEKWPNFQTAPPEKPLPRAWTTQQIVELMDAARETDGHIGAVPAGVWWYNLHRFAWETGERLGAMLKARWDDVDSERCLIEIPAKYRKAKTRGMLYTISEDLMGDLVAMREFKTAPHFHLPINFDVIFYWPFTESTFYNHYDKILKRAGLPTDHRSKMHRIRRSFASHLEANGGNATEALKHSSRRITANSYLDESIIQRTPAFKMLPKLEGGEQ